MSRRTTAFRPETASVSARISQPLLPQACNHCWHTNASARRHLHRTMTDDTVRVGMVHAKTREDPRLRSCVLLLHYSYYTTLCTVYSLHSVLFALCTLCTLYSLHCVLFALCTLCTVYSLHCVLFALCTLCTVYYLHCVLFALLCALCTVYYLHCVLFALCALRTVYYLRYSLHCVLFALLFALLFASHTTTDLEKKRKRNRPKLQRGGVTFGRAFSCNDSRSLAKASDPPVSSRARAFVMFSFCDTNPQWNG